MIYKIVDSSRFDGLVKRVNELIQEGFEPHGSLIVTVVDEEEWFYQPMLKRLPKEV